jgi:hypothetical protein
MPRIPAAFRGYFHPQARRTGNSLRTTPSAQPIVPAPVTRYTRRISGVPLTGGQVQAIVPASGNLTLQVGPQGLGTVWYPTQVTISTTLGPADTAVALVYAGPLITPSTLVATVYSGNGTISLALPSMTPGQTVIVAWTGATQGNTAAASIVGTMDALSL